MINKKKIYFSALVIFIIVSSITWVYIDYLQNQRDNLTTLKNFEQVKSMRQDVSTMIFQKQKSTVAMALAMVNDNSLSKRVYDKNVSNDYYLNLIEKFKTHTLYKNIWVQVFDENTVSLYRSWNPKKGDSLLDIRKDLRDVIKTKKVSFSISVGKFDLSIKAIVPVFYNGKFVGIIEVISHFNSISKQLNLHDIKSVVLLKKEYKKQLSHPFTKSFINDYYVANFDAPRYEKEYLKKNGVENYFNNSQKIENGYLIVSYPLKNVNSKVIGYFIMFKQVDSISNLELDFLMFRGMAFIIIAIMAIAITISGLLYFSNKRLRKYYKRIIDSSSNIVIINNTKSLISMNKVFFKYFKEYKNLYDFTQDHKCICEFFEDENGYITQYMDSVYWVEYLVQNPLDENKVKIIVDDKALFFSATASLISEDSGDYSIVLSDITQAENAKIELERLTVTDTLTGIGNRRHFHQKMQEEISRAKRNEYELSVIMFDIDHFKRVNDRYGHDVGDEVLKEYTKLISSSLRETDVFSRIGGEEFIIILPNANKENAMKIAEKLRSTVEAYKKVVPITMSFGVTQYIKGEDIEFILKRVDNALYMAKDSGRNRVYG